jgi:hypothetical protein
VAFTAEIFTSAIIVVGDFNPAIFSPDWLERNDLIGEGDAIAAREGKAGRHPLVSHQVTTFETDWFTLQVLDTQFSLTSKGVLSPAFKDLAVGIFQLVPQTPVKAVGLNFIGHFKLESQELHHKIGDVFAPKDIWGGLYPDEFVGLEQLVIRIQRGSREKGADSNDEKRITLQRSNKFKYGIHLSFNDHHDVTTCDESDLTPAENVAKIVDEQWQFDWDDAVRVFDQLLSEAATR